MFTQINGPAGQLTGGAVFGAVTTEPIDDDPRAVIRTLSVDFHGSCGSFPAQATYSGKTWWLTDLKQYGGMASFKLQRAEIADCNCTASIITIDRTDDCGSLDTVKSSLDGVRTIARHVSGQSVRILDASIPTSLWEFDFEPAYHLTTRHMIGYENRTFKVLSVENANHPLKLTTVTAEMTPLPRATP